MIEKEQLTLELPAVDIEPSYNNSKGKYTVDISHIYRFYILINWLGVLEKSKVLKKGTDAIFECDNETIADEILDCIASCKKRKIYKVPNFNPICITGLDKVSVNHWKFAVERKLGYEKSQYFRSVTSKWDF
ncbi:hypothetical protein F892_00008 [Acinetobacter vivianii]|uniref:Uncharacterized protein n=1 Tax=Acinetobacter vivianii TaxID=1776742 RepID=N9NUV5_9GAMM|nr:hypothetical protein [Acinetobacter vivianii]ENX24858.1 hypothetical protein F892_00008 [Acinetobacter vivianii]GGI62119.1 hypothetical protein GCM10011446_36140 [Acinetobacter vivianii]